MSDFVLEPYDAGADREWDELVARSRNGNMLHQRGYMGYHAHRFDECSLRVRKKDKLVAVFPANREAGRIISHGGLTYGGLIYALDLHAEGVLEVMQAIRRYYASEGAKSLLYKAIPHVFHRYPCEEDLYALFRLDARLIRRDLSSVVVFDGRPKFSDSRKCTIRGAVKQRVTISEETGLANFHALLEETLARKGVVPVHALAELEMLQSRFPAAIRVFGARRDDVLLAATLLYDFGHIVHTQYLASSEEGRRIGALDLLLANLMTEEFSVRRYFSFGISTEQGGRALNGGLIFQKEGFGGRGVVHDFYELEL